MNPTAEARETSRETTFKVLLNHQFWTNPHRNPARYVCQEDPGQLLPALPTSASPLLSIPEGISWPINLERIIISCGISLLENVAF